VEDAGLLRERTGVVLGVYDKRYLRQNGYENMLVVAPPGAGKTQGVIIPTLLAYNGPVVVLDIKGELWDATAGWRDRYSHCLYYNPTTKEGVRHNPLLEIRRGENEVRDAGNIADILVDPEGAKEHLDHWEKNAHNLLIGGILHVLYAERQKSLAGLTQFFTDPRRNFSETLNIMLRTCHVDGQPHPVVASVAREMLNKSGNELSGVQSTTMTFLGIYRDPLVAHTTNTSDFTLSQLNDPELPWSLYLCLPASDISRLRPLYRMFLNQLGRTITETVVPRQQRGLLVLDEFASLGHLDFFETVLGYLRGYYWRALLVVQSTNQIMRHYGNHQSIIDNCDIRVMMAANDGDTAKRIETMLGEATILVEQQGYSGDRMKPWYTNSNLSLAERGRPLMTTAEILQMGADKEVIFMTNRPPILAQKIRAWRDQIWVRRGLPAPSKRPRQLPEFRESLWLNEGPKPMREEKQS
jgi:type IV secretion system protein VirD4